MTTITKNNVINAIFSAISDAMAYTDFSNVDLNGNINDQLNETLQDNDYYFNECPLNYDYTHEQIEIVTSSDFSQYELYDKPDFSSCENAMQCIALEAAAILDVVSIEAYSDYLDEVEEKIEEMREELTEYHDEFFDLTLSFDNECTWGDIPHDYENENGVMIWANRGASIHFDCVYINVSIN